MKLGVWPKRIFFALAAIFFVFTFVHASWLAPSPRGAPKLIAHRALGQPLLVHGASGDEECLTARIEQPYHPYIEDTLKSARDASYLGANLVEVNVLPTGDGDLVLYHDDDLKCRTGADGKVGEMTVEQLKQLDIGWGYVTEEGEHPLRGTGVGQMPTVGEALDKLRRPRFLFNLKGEDPAAADRLAAKLKTAPRQVRENDHAFLGQGPVIQRAAELFPDAWVIDLDRAIECTTGYMATGWLTIVPEACENGTLLVPLNRQWLVAGWPNRTIARMDEVGARIVVVGDYDGEHVTFGLDLPSQFGDIPDTFNGYIFVDDLYILGPALRPGLNRRDQAERDRLGEVLKRRREAR